LFGQLHKLPVQEHSLLFEQLPELLQQAATLFEQLHALSEQEKIIKLAIKANRTPKTFRFFINNPLKINL